MSDGLSRVASATAYILQRAKEERFRVGKVRLTKLLYLLDVEHYRRTNRTYTGIKWIFYKYGPYAPTLDRALSEAGFAIGEEEFDGKSFKEVDADFADHEELAEKIEPMAKRLLDTLWNEWGLEAFENLLDYVYFETEPMEGALRGEPLDFTKILPAEHAVRLEWDEDEKAALREIGSRLRRTLEGLSVSELPAIPSGLAEILSIWEEEEAENLGPLMGDDVAL